LQAISAPIRPLIAAEEGADRRGDGRVEVVYAARKIVVAIIRPSQLDAVLEAVSSIGVVDIAVGETLRACGDEDHRVEIYWGERYTVRLAPKIKLEMTVPVASVDAVIETVIRATDTGQAGDWNLSVMDLNAVVETVSDRRATPFAR
jgi:nitrogen regulatory protein P-II 2